MHTLKDGTRVTVASRWSRLSDEASAADAIIETNYEISERRTSRRSG